MLNAKPLPPRVRAMIVTVAHQFDLTAEEIIGAGQGRAQAWARHVAMYLVRRITAASAPQIGRWFGGRHHTTVLYATAAVSERMANNMADRELVEGLIAAAVSERMANNMADRELVEGLIAAAQTPTNSRRGRLLAALERISAESANLHTALTTFTDAAQVALGEAVLAVRSQAERESTDV